MDESSDEMTTQTNLIFWRLAYFFVVEQEYTLTRLSQDRREMLLENRSVKKAAIIRLSQQNLGWAASLGRDIEQTAWVGERLRKQRGMRKLNMLNVMVSPHQPVDEFSQFMKPVQSGKTQTAVLLFTEENLGGPLQELERFMESVPEQREFEGADDEAAAYERAVLSHEVKRKEEENRFFYYGKPFFTYVFTAVNVIMFFLMTIAGGSTATDVLIQFGAKFNPLILEGEWWRFITPVFLHIGLLHLLMNSMALYYLGTAVEQIYGRLRFLWIYLFSGFTGSLLSFLLTPNLSAGASGAIFGLFGALLYFGVTKPKLFFRTMGMNVLVVIGINLAFGFTVPGIDNAGHIGGLIGGFLATGIVHFPKKRRILQQLLFLAAASTFVAVGLFFGFQHGYAALDAQSVNIQAADKLQDGNKQEAERILSNFIQKGGQPSAETYFYLGVIKAGDGRLEEAASHFKQAVRLRSNFSEAHYNLALIYSSQGRQEEALQAAEQAAAYAPNEQTYEDLVRKLNNE
ncbi:rhomboid family intramembrane serine protease [Domibacillus sp. PGB-M46]|uniref:rhomboid family intramembrane serine protease n=1 Tax=Domibacillus sp. PGB-M46 TaxID=2910255 RepID=UPI001F55D9BC|nr:rhomboid family intramembrane serine protease [Domibacillus sp. PGB-M46]MCI2254540.1 rhomboid family intramembrane serine protease [Domibacillus sp. PGB-M46]